MFSFWHWLNHCRWKELNEIHFDPICYFYDTWFCWRNNFEKKRNETDRLEYKVPPYFHSPKIIQVASVDIDFQKTNWQWFAFRFERSINGWRDWNKFMADAAERTSWLVSDDIRKPPLFQSYKTMTDATETDSWTVFDHSKNFLALIDIRHRCMFHMLHFLKF